ncbi:MAG: hypothetical protein D6714_08895 [Bacteroidetes bacterium]|nr:MAG: hypothetical protein D6714_08895 [Bacteroidota bacterium]
MKIALLSMTNISVSNATGSLLARLFEGIPPDDIVQVTKYRHSDEVADRYTRHIPFYDFLERQRASENRLVKLPAAALRRLLFPLMFFVGNKHSVLRQLRNFQPDLLYLRVVAEPFYYLPLALFLKKNLGIPLVLHFMDDYDLHLQIEARKNPVRYIQSRLYRHFLRQVIAQSDLRFAISENMARAFQTRYGASFLVAHNGIDREAFEWFQSVKYEKARPKRVLWAGAIEVDKDHRIIHHIAGAIERINADIPCEFLLNVPENFATPAKKLADRYATVRWQTYQPLEAYKKLLATASVLIIARNFDEKTRAYTQFSFHNKLPDFLASGTPVLAIGPEWDNTVQLFKKYNFGPVIDQEDPNRIENELRSLLSDNAPNPSDPARAARVFDMETIRQHFQTRLLKMIE